jgi:hypothetical protein
MAFGRSEGVLIVRDRPDGSVIPSSLDGDSSRLPSDAGRAHPRPWLRAHGHAGPSSRPDTGSVSVSGLAGITSVSVERFAHHQAHAVDDLLMGGGRFGIGSANGSRHHGL